MRILATFDESAFSEAIVPTLSKLAVLPGVEIALCAIAEVTAAFDEDAIRARREDLEAYLRKVASTLPGGTTYSVGTDVAMYPMDSASLLIKYVKQEECDMVVMATHGRTGLSDNCLAPSPKRSFVPESHQSCSCTPEMALAARCVVVEPS